MMKLSIISVTFNNAEGLEKTITSITEQTIQDFELIVVDGGSTDETKSVVNKYEGIIDVFVSEKDNGIYDAMNKGIAFARSEYCLFLNAGDCFFSKNVLEEVLPFLDKKDVVYGDSFKVKPYYRRKITYPDKLSLLDFYRITPPLHHQASFIRKELFDVYGNYDLNLPVFADWEFFFRAIILNNVTYLHIPLLVCRFDGTGMSNSIAEIDPRRKEINDLRYKILQCQFPEYILSDYERFDKIISHQSFFTKLKNKIAYFSFKK